MHLACTLWVAHRRQSAVNGSLCQWVCCGKRGMWGVLLALRIFALSFLFFLSFIPYYKHFAFSFTSPRPLLIQASRPTSQKQNEYYMVLWPSTMFYFQLISLWISYSIMSVWVISEPEIGEDWISLGFLSSALREKSIVGNRLWDSLTVGTNEKKKKRKKRKLSSLKAISKILDNDSRK
jgi:hypothetical protein